MTATSAPKPANAVHFLSVGTKILTKDVMDQFIRTPGFQPHALRSQCQECEAILSENPIDVLIFEFDLPDSTGFALLQYMRTMKAYDSIYYVFGIEEQNLPLKNLGLDMGVDDVLIKPFNTNDIGKLLERAKSFRSHKGDDVRRTLRLGEIAFRDKNYAEAEQFFKKAVAAAPEDVEVNHRAGAYFLNTPHLASSEKYLTKALLLNGDYTPALGDYAEFLWKKKRFKDAFNYLWKAHELSPLNTDRIRILASFFMDWSTELLKSGNRLDPKNAALNFELAKLHLFNRDYPNALKILREAELSETHKYFEESQNLILFAQKQGSLK